MRTFQIILGSMFALGALFTGGCSLLFGISFIVEGDDGYGFWIFPLIGAGATALLAWIAWLFLRRPPAPAAPAAPAAAGEPEAGPPGPE